MIAAYLSAIRAIEQANRIYLEAIGKIVYEIGPNDINIAGAMVLINIGNDKVELDKIRNRVSYTDSHANSVIRALVRNGYLSHERSGHDRRIIRVWISVKGSQLRDRLIEMHKGINPKVTSSRSFDCTVRTLRLIEDLFIDQELDR